MTTERQDEDFLKAVIPRTLLEKSIEWIRENMEPEDIFAESDLERWAKDNGMEYSEE